jgi:tetratricopeptide (TPR) repeat protein
MEEITDKFDVLVPDEISGLLLYYINSNNINLILLLKYINKKSLNDPEYLHLLGNYYSHIKNNKEMLKCFTDAVNKNYKPSIKTLIIYYAKNKEFKNMEVYVTKFISVINDEIKNYEADDYKNLEKANKEMLEMIRYAGFKYGKSDKLEDMAHRLKVCVDDFNDITSMAPLGNCYHKMENFSEMEKYYLKGIHNSCGISALNYGKYLYSINNFEEMIKCYNIAIQHGNKHAFFEFYLYYKNLGNEEKLNKYYKLVTENKELIEQFYEIDIENRTLFIKQT